MTAPTDLWGLWSDRDGVWDGLQYPTEYIAKYAAIDDERPVRLTPAPTFGVPEVLVMLRERLAKSQRLASEALGERLMLTEAGYAGEVAALLSVIADIEAAAKERA